MSPFEIALIMIGIVCIVVSCFFVDRTSTDTVDTELGTVTEQILYSHLSDANEKIAKHMEQLEEEVFERTNEEMGRISNEKIMAVHEYSEQAIQEIKKNHEEVLFLYQMLTDKEAELKATMAAMRQNSHSQQKQAENRKDSDSMKHSKSNQTSQTAKSKSLLEDTKNHQETHYSQTIQNIENQEFSSHIDEILQLSNQGYTVVEISKKLGLGQGEVKLVLDYNKK